MLRKMILSVACVAVVGMMASVANAATLPAVLFTDSGSSSFSLGTLDNTQGHTDSTSALWAIGGPWNNGGFEMQDGQASLNDLDNNGFSFYYKIPQVQGLDHNVRVQFGMNTWIGVVADAIDSVVLDLVGTGNWEQAIVPAGDVTISAEMDGENMNSDRTYRLTAQDWPSGTVNAPYPYDLNVDDVTVIPEPASLALLGLGGLVMLRRRRA